ncbi:hypothetical protein Golob_025330, partial [Gossypium lobatum]|nr:hypothetical protein [Gossypium lobatum]
MGYLWAISNNPIVVGVFIYMPTISFECGRLNPFIGTFGFLYKRSLLKIIRSTIENVIKVDYNIDIGVQGRFARMVIIVDLSKLLISKIKIEDITQRGEFGWALRLPVVSVKTTVAVRLDT